MFDLPLNDSFLQLLFNFQNYPLPNDSKTAGPQGVPTMYDKNKFVLPRKICFV